MPGLVTVKNEVSFDVFVPFMRNIFFRMDFIYMLGLCVGREASLAWVNTEVADVVQY